MAEILVEGLHRLQGGLTVQGSKNAALPMMAASVLHRGVTVLTNIPRIQDVFCMMGILNSIGCHCSLDDHVLSIDATTISQVRIPEQFLTSMRSSIILMGALLGRCQEAEAGYPGGCSIGKRPIDLHLFALRKLGAVITEKDGKLSARTEQLNGEEICFSYPSVGATEQAILAAILAKGMTVIRGAAREPEVESLCRMLNSMGADIEGAGTDILRIQGVTALRDVCFPVPGDRIVAGTYLCGVMAAGGEAELKGVNPAEMTSVLQISRQMGAEVVTENQKLRVRMKRRPERCLVKTSPYPGFPTDLQSLCMAVMCVGNGEGEIQETVFEGRFATAGELIKMGARIEIWRDRARILGNSRLYGNDLAAADLRGGAALVVAGLAAEGTTRIRNSYHIDRGYEDICRDFKSLGAKIREITGEHTKGI